MYVVVAYDVRDAGRSNRIRRFLRRYLFRIQLSVWEGELSLAQAREVEFFLRRISRKEDSIRIWLIRDPSRVERISIGKDPEPLLQKALFL